MIGMSVSLSDTQQSEHLQPKTNLMHRVQHTKTGCMISTTKNNGVGSAVCGSLLKVSLRVAHVTFCFFRPKRLSPSFADWYLFRKIALVLFGCLLPFTNQKT